MFVYNNKEMSDLWKELHKRAFNHNQPNDSLYLTTFATRIPKYHNCNCQEFWNTWIKNNPPSYGTDTNGNNKYFEWTIKTHNAVNKKLNKPTVTLEDAIKLYK